MSIESPGRPANLVSIQYLRGLAALGVVAFHAVGEAGGQFAIGASGVNLFFVISGFIMVWITQDGSRPAPFLRDRIRRIVPLYWLATACWVILSSLRTRAFGFEPEKIALSLVFFPHGPPGEGSRYFPVHGVGWTLNYEALFYTIMAASLLLPARWRLWAASAALIGLVAVGIALRPSSPPLAFWTHSIIIHFLAGAWLAVAFKAETSAVSRKVASAIVVAIIAVTPPIAFPVLLVTAALTFERHGLMPRTRLLMLGDASYSVYLFHPMGIMIGATVLSKLAVSGPVLAAVGMVAGLASGFIAYWLLECPIQGAVMRASGVRQTCPSKLEPLHNPSR